MDSFRRGPLTFDLLDTGPRDGTPVVLLHGFPQSAHSWDLVAARLHAAGLRTYAPDQRGYSPGARPADRRAYALGELVEDVRALLDAASLDRAHVVGHDWGANVAWAVAAAYPDRVQTLTALSVPHPAAYVRALTRGWQLPHSWYIGAFQVPGLAERVLSPETPAGRTRLVQLLVRTGLPRADAEAAARFLDSPGALTAALGWYRALPFADRHLMSARTTVPTTFVWSDRDRYITRSAAEGCGRFVAGPYRFEILREVDHWIPETAPDLVSALIVERVTAV